MSELDILKIFLFDNGLALHKNEQTIEKINQMVINLIEYNNVEVPKQLKQWYNKHRTFNINVDNEDILGEITSHMSLRDLEHFCKTNKQYQSHCGKLLSKRVLQEQGIYLLEKPKTYQEWVIMYNKSKEAIFKTDRLFNLINYEKENGNPHQWLFLVVDIKNNTKLNLLPFYSLYDSTKINGYNNLNYDRFNLILNIEHNTIYYKYIKDGKKYKEISIRNVDPYDIVYRFYYYYYPNEYILDLDDLTFDKDALLQELPSLTGDSKDKALFRLEYLENY